VLVLVLPLLLLVFCIASMGEAMPKAQVVPLLKMSFHGNYMILFNCSTYTTEKK
jgi:hypothetical protein